MEFDVDDLVDQVVRQFCFVGDGAWTVELFPIHVKVGHVVLAGLWCIFRIHAAKDSSRIMFLE